MRILVLGAGGFIGSVIARTLAARGHEVSGLGRDIARASRRMPEVRWIRGDLAEMTEPSAWRQLVSDHDAVINCAGALQDGLSDDLDATQERAMTALYAALSGDTDRFVIQISARTDGTGADTPFLATKRRADDALKASGVQHFIFRPALVVGRNAHGGTALLRALASFPLAVPLVHGDSPVQTVDVEDVALAVTMAVDGDLPDGTDMHLCAEGGTTLRDIVAAHRQWLGLKTARTVNLPGFLAKPVSFAADLAGRLGWRSPLRSTAMAVMTGGVSGDGKPPKGWKLRSVQDTLRANPSGVQDLWFARLYLLKPMVLVTLAAFWLLSGIVPLIDPDRAAAHFNAFMPETAARFLTVATCWVDIALGLTVLFRPTARKSLLAMLAVTASYVVGGTVLEPSLWADPLGPLVKVLPSVTLTLVALATLEER